MSKWMTGIMMAGMLAASGAQAQAPAATPAAAPAAAPAVAPAVKPASSWADKIVLKGDVRYRYESIDDDSKTDSDGDTYTRQRDRLRVRAGLEAKMTDTMKAGVELSTGGVDPVSGNQTLGGGFDKEEMRMSLGYFDATVVNQDPTTVNVVGGKMKNPFINVSDLVWDGDLNPEGLAVKAQTGNEMLSAMGNGGYMWVQERDKASDDSMLYAGQGAVKLQPAAEFYAMVGATYYGFQNMEGYDVLDWEKSNKSYGNSTTAGTTSGSTTNKAYKYDFTPVELFVELGTFIGKLPVTLFGQMLSNSDADEYDSGFLYGLSLGKAKNPKTYEVGWRYAELEKDAMVGAFTDSDRWGGGTDGQGHKVYGKYQFAKNFQGAVSYFMDEKVISDPAKTTDYDRLQVDVNFIF